MTIRLAPIADASTPDIESLLDAAFGPDRRARTAYRLRAETTAIPSLSFAAFDGEVLVGSIQCWPVALGETPLTLVGPVAVAPDRQRSGIGRMLMERLLATAPDLPMVMIGDPEYYDRFFGFSAELTAGWEVPGPVDRRRLLARNIDGLPRTGRLAPRAFAIAGTTA